MKVFPENLKQSPLPTFQRLSSGKISEKPNKQI